nr:hypothetical protein GCM10020092_006640 [Actinoplanes digitatis]
MTTSRTPSRARSEPRPAYQCDACGHQPPKWLGRCPECNEWGSVIESTMTGPVVAGRVVSSRLPSEPARPIATISAAPAKAVPSGVSELDRVLGGGLVPGAVVLLAGEPGVGKSTLLLDVAQQWAARHEHAVARGQRRGVGQPGPAARRAARRAARQPLPGLRE